jgi:hypothetical protein
MIMAGFTSGWFLSGQRGLTGGEMPPGREGVELSAPTERSLPETDVPGSDIPELPRYPGSVMFEYEQKLYGNIMVTKADYLSADADVEEVKAFYRDVFRRGGWRVNDLSFSQGEWEFFVVKGEREATIEIEPEDGLIEIEIEISRPHPTPAQQAPPAVVGDDDDLYEEFEADD